MAEPPLNAGNKFAYRLEIDSGLSVVSGRVLAPKALLDPAQRWLLQAGESDALDEVVVPGAALEVVNAQGEVDSRVTAVASDAGGNFRLRGIPVNEAVYVRARFKNKQGQERSLYVYVRPAGLSTCTEVSLPTTVVSHFTCTRTPVFPIFKPDAIKGVLPRVRESLPTALSALAAASGKTADNGFVEAQLASLVTGALPGGCDVPDNGTFGTPNALFTAVVKADPTIGRALDTAIETYLMINLVFDKGTGSPAPYRLMSDVGSNRSSLPKLRKLLSETTEFMIKTPASQFKSFSYWINDAKIADAVYADGQWGAKVDTRKLANGPSVLSAIASSSSGATVIAASLLVFVQNGDTTVPDPCAEAPAEQAASAP